MKLNLFFLFSLAFYFNSFSQNLVSIRGKVVDSETNQGAIGASVWVETPEKIGVATDLDGNFKLENIPAGKITINCSYLGYETYTSSPITLSTGKELVLTIKLNEQIVKTGVVVITGTKKGRAKNESMVVSSKSFDISETQRFAASLNDPGRVVLNYPGVQAGQDNDNDVLVRGNSAFGVLWRLEGIDVPNLSHFSRPGSSGGGITALSPNLVARSDFSTGAFPAEYGNATSSVFDVKFRKGNNERYEFSANVGILGLNFGAEGPFSKKGKSSFLFNYRYSTLSVLDAIGIHVVSAKTENIYQDASFNINLPTKKKARFNIFGVGGISSEITKAISDVSSWDEYEDRLETNFLSNLGVVGISWTQLLDDKSYIKTVVAGAYNDIVDNDDTLSTTGIYSNLRTFEEQRVKIALNSIYNRKFNSRFSLKTGVSFDQKFYDLDVNELVDSTNTKKQIILAKGNTQQAQAFAQLKFRASDKATLLGGLHANYLFLNNTYSIEPRFSYHQQIGKVQSISLAYGLNSQALGMGSYFTQELDNFGNSSLVNVNLEMIKSHHLILAYDITFLKNYHLKLEPYFQYIYDAPVSSDLNNTLYLLNERSGYAEEEMLSKGNGINYGIDFSFEKYYTKNWFAMLNASLFSSRFQTLSGDWYSSHYDNRFGISAMGGKTFVFKKNSSSLELGLRVQFSGGFRYTPIDEVASNEQKKIITLDGNQTYAQTLKNYFRPDFRIAYKQNKKKLTWSVSLDLANFVDYKNQLRPFYDRVENEVAWKYQTGFTPVIAFQLDFYKTLKRD
ncbi:MAG: hypothetical protein ACI8ZX_000856 [Planctomycetota bacterium]|jgi:hypothetical protein